jgi:hypothetical protein
MNHEELEQIYKNAIEDPTLLSTINIDALLEKIGENHYLEGKTVADVSKEIFEAIQSLDITEKEAKDFCLRLSGHRLVDRICDLRNGILLRWVKKGTSYLTNGGLLMNVKIEKTGVQLLCKNNAHRFFNVKFDDCIIFQKMTMEEQLVLMANGL